MLTHHRIHNAGAVLLANAGRQQQQINSSMPIIKCNTTQLTAVLVEQYYEVYAQNQNIPVIFQCKRTIPVSQGQEMQVYLKVSQQRRVSFDPKNRKEQMETASLSIETNFTTINNDYLYISLQASRADQCVQVTDQLDSSQTSYVICAQSGQELYQSTGSVVTVTYPGKNTTTRITSFQVFYHSVCRNKLC
ncbi:hypothetical protein FGIG_09998 [Fasciola gigantica]|uniref:Uncharacterized protein n=1 Tax=Fasciola gigantica TaxID=46835 RepID=A0A504YRZ2_FASGI|nr:hypothetical protein FGIG_09998 [Fasciola gigantica]